MTTDAVGSVVHLTGELDLETAGLLAPVVQALVDGGRLDVSVDLGGLTFCDLRGLYALRAAQARVRSAGGRLTIVRPSPFLQHVADLCGLSFLFEVVV